MKNKKTEKARNDIFTALNYLRLKADLAAIEAEIENNRPLSKAEDENVLLKALNSISVDFQNELRRGTMHDLTAERKRAMDALLRFERTADKNALSLANNPDALRKTGEKRLWHNDPYGLLKIQFAIAYAGSSADAFLRSERSLSEVSHVLFGDRDKISHLCTSFRKNFAALEKRGIDDFCASIFTVDLFAFPSLSRSFGFISTAFGPSKDRQLKAAMDSLSKDEVRALLAMKLTLIESTEPSMPEKARKEQIDDVLKHIDNLRADAEYEWLVEKMDIPSCKEKLSLASLAISRLAVILEA